MTGKGTVSEPYRFDDEFPGKELEQWNLAYTWCRDWNRPVVVQVGNETSRIFPSGDYKVLRLETTTDDLYCDQFPDDVSAQMHMEVER